MLFLLYQLSSFYLKQKRTYTVEEKQVPVKFKNIVKCNRYKS